MAEGERITERLAGPHWRQRSASARHRGFTLIELLVVIGIIALLMAVLVPSLSLARKRARAIVCRSHLKGWGTTLGLYLEENGGRFSHGLSEGVASELSLLTSLRISDNDPNVSSSRYHGVRTEGIALCPMASKGEETIDPASASQSIVATMATVFTPWQVRLGHSGFRMSYGLNSHLFNRFFISGLTSSIHQQYSYTDVFSLKNRINIPLLFDATTYSSSLPDPRYPPPSKEITTHTDAVCINRHRGAINFLLLDLSVAEVGLKGLWTLRWNLGFDTHGPWTRSGSVQPEDWPEWMRGFKDY